MLEELKKRLVKLTVERTQLFNTYMQYNGHIQECEFLIKMLEEKAGTEDQPKPEEQQNEEAA